MFKLVLVVVIVVVDVGGVGRVFCIFVNFGGREDFVRDFRS